MSQFVEVLEPADKPMDVLDMGDGSDNPDRDILQRIKIQLEMDRLAKFEAEYTLKMEQAATNSANVENVEVNII